MSTVNAKTPAFLFLSITVKVVTMFNVSRNPMKEKRPSQGDLKIPILPPKT